MNPRHARLQKIIRLFFLLLIIMQDKASSQDLAISDSLTPPKKKDWNEFDFGFTTMRIGMAAIFDGYTYSQDENSKKQVDSLGGDLSTAWQWRDFRFFANGRFKLKRTVIWKIAGMYDGANKEWTFRETGLLIGLPELKGEVFIGRSKEGFSLNKVQNGYSVWGAERQMSLDLISIMADGIRYYGYLPKQRLFWSIGAFSNLFYGHNSKFDLWEWQYAGRFGWRPIYDEKQHKLVHLALNFRYAKPDQDKITVKSRPESNAAPYFINTGEFESDKSTTIGYEAYYQSGPFMIGSEGNSYYFHSTQANNPKFSGLAVEGTYILTGESIPYLSNNSAFFFVEPKKPLFKGGFGAVQVCLRYSTFDTNHGSMHGGYLWKITPWVNWYPVKYFRMDFVYGYGVLDRFNIQGATQFYQIRFQLQIM